MNPYDTRQWTLLLASTLTVMAGAALAPALPALEAAFAETPRAPLLTRLVVTLPALFIVLAAPLAGWLVDRVGRVRLLVAAVALYVVSGVSGALVDRLEVLLVGRALLGVAIAGLMTSVSTLIADYHSGPERDRLYGHQGAFMSLGGIAFLVGGGLTADLHWRASFLIYLLPVLLLPLALRLPEPARSAPAAGGDLASVPRSKLAVIYAAALVGMAIFYVIPVQLPYHLVGLTGASATITGLAIATSNLMGGLSGFAFARLRRALGPGQIFVLIYSLMAAGYALIAVARDLPTVLAGLALAGLGLGMTVPNLSTWLASFTPPALRGRLIAGLTGAVFVGQFLSPLIAQPFVEAHGSAGPFAACAGLLCLMGLVAFVLRGRA
jgi:MFS family permease